MSEPRTFEDHLKAWTGRDLDFHVRAGATGIEFGRSCWEASDKATRAALLADRPIPEGLIEALGRQTRIDEDGTLCGVCRQAVDEARELLESQAAQLAALKADYEIMARRADNEERASERAEKAKEPSR